MIVANVTRTIVASVTKKIKEAAMKAIAEVVKSDVSKKKPLVNRLKKLLVKSSRVVSNKMLFDVSKKKLLVRKKRRKFNASAKKLIALHANKMIDAIKTTTIVVTAKREKKLSTIAMIVNTRRSGSVTA